MAGVAIGLLAAEVTRAGGLGMIAAGHLQNVADLEAQIEIFKKNTAKATMGNNTCPSSSPSPSSSSPPPSDLAIGFIGFSSLATPAGWEDYAFILRKYRPKAVQFFAPFLVECPGGGGGGSDNNVRLVREHGSKFIAQVGSISEARLAMEHVVDAIICQGGEAGGHGLRRELGSSAMALALQTKRIAGGVPVLTSGGVVNGRHLASALCYCDGASIRTRYWACQESIGDGALQRRLVNAGNTCDDVLRTAVFDAIQNQTAAVK